MTIKHGGNLLQIIAQYGGEESEWVDLSTGVSPFTYPVGNIPESVWNRLPQPNDGLERAAKTYYQAAQEPVAIAGSQAGIMILPAIVRQLRADNAGVIALPKVGYKEHQHAWLKHSTECHAGSQSDWQVIWYDDFPSVEQVKQSDVVLVINPNNPSGYTATSTELLHLHQQLIDNGGMLIVDEAFVDTQPDNSILTKLDKLEHIVVFRSVGKFFGLAGARVGFLFADQEIRQQVYQRIGPWTVTGPSRWIMKQALTDVAWQVETSKKLSQASERLQQLLTDYLVAPLNELNGTVPLSRSLLPSSRVVKEAAVKGTVPFNASSKVSLKGTDLFCTVSIEEAVFLHDWLCQHAIFTRLCDEQDGVRFGLPADESQWKKLEAAMVEFSQLVSRTSALAV
ncbi:threonine-phosphate decarboxylase [Vibrio sp. MA40-2]|uniref:threonine-phosphate decarboxylase n=1 Tax=Vibrio sp. MA40-2 TaxID=3391828 RepID=UPI0039A74BE0